MHRQMKLYENYIQNLPASLHTWNTWNSISDFTSPPASCIEEERFKCQSIHAHVDPIKIVELFITNELIGDIAFQTNLNNIQRSTAGYKVAVKKGDNWAILHRKITPPVTNAEIKRLFGIIFLHGHYQISKSQTLLGGKNMDSFYC